MILDDFIMLPRLLFEQSDMSVAELSKLSGIGYNRLDDILEGNSVPTFEDIDLIREAMGLTDDMVADILNKAKK